MDIINRKLLSAICVIIGLTLIIFNGVELYKLIFELYYADTSHTPINWPYKNDILTIKFNFLKSMITWGILFLFLGTFLFLKKNKTN